MTKETTKADRLITHLREAIERGEYPEGSRVPSERELEEKFDVSRDTVRRALKELEATGHVWRKGTAGTFVGATAQRAPAQVPRGVIPFIPSSPLVTVDEQRIPRPGFHFDDVLEPGHIIHLAPVGLLAPNEYVARRLNLPGGSLVLRRLRLFTDADGYPYQIADGFYPENPFKELLHLDPDTLIVEEWLQARHGRRPKRVLEAVRFRRATEYEVETLYLSGLPSVVVEVERQVLDQDGQPLEMARLVTSAAQFHVQYEYDVDEWTAHGGEAPPVIYPR